MGRSYEAGLSMDRVLELYESGFLEGEVIEKFDLQVPGTELRLKGRVIEFKGGACIVQTYIDKDSSLLSYFKDRENALKYLEEEKKPYLELRNLHREITNRKSLLQHLKQREENVKEEMRNRLNELREEIKKTESQIKALKKAFDDQVKSLKKA
ncbi:hypothetical protein J7L06_01880 [Candidatus Bathyarchaeota archaeon]|nr:hypothetical protein [Candidatus Bathyarchaeota archaeon]